jgi:hypothetical protein
MGLQHKSKIYASKPTGGGAQEPANRVLIDAFKDARLPQIVTSCLHNDVTCSIPVKVQNLVLG